MSGPRSLVFTAVALFSPPWPLSRNSMSVAFLETQARYQPRMHPLVLPCPALMTPLFLGHGSKEE